MKNEGFTWDFFISFAGRDELTAEALYDLLSLHSKVFMSNRCIKPGDNWAQELTLAQSNSRITVALISAATEQAPYQQEEIATAIEMERKDKDRHRIVPVFLDTRSCESINMPIGVRLKQGLSLPKLKSDKEVAKGLLNLLDKLNGKAITADNSHKRTDGQRRVKAMLIVPAMLKKRRVIIPILLVAAAMSLFAIWGIPRFRAVAHVPSPEARTWYYKGIGALRDGAYYQASNFLRDAAHKDRYFVLAHVYLIDALMELGNDDEAEQELNHVDNILNEHPSATDLEKLYVEAATAIVRSNFNRAIKAYTRIKDLDPKKPQAYIDLGRVYEKNDDVEAAIKNYLKAKELHSDYPSVYLRLGILYYRQQEREKAEEAFQKAEDLYRNNDEGMTEVLFQRGNLLNDLNDIAAARPLLERALKLAREKGYKYHEIKSLLQLSSISESEGKRSQAQMEARQAGELAIEERIETLQARALVALGNTQLHTDPEAAEKNYKSALKIAGEKMRRNKAVALYSLGNLYLYVHDDADKALNYLAEALPIFEKGGYRKYALAAMTLINDANCMKGNCSSAVGEFQEALKRAETLQDNSQAALMHDKLAMYFIQQEQYPEALAHAQKSSEINQRGDQLYKGYSLTNYGNALWRLGRYKDARAMFDQALTIAEWPGGGYKKLSLLINQSYAEMALSEGNFSEAKEKSEKALESNHAEVSARHNEAECIHKLAQALLSPPSQKIQLSNEALQKAKDLKDPQMLSLTYVTLAEAMLGVGDANGALKVALKAQEEFKSSGLQHSQLRAWLIASRASQRAGDDAKAREYRLNAQLILTDLEQKMGAAFIGYISRPDLKNWL